MLICFNQTQSITETGPQAFQMLTYFLKHSKLLYTNVCYKSNGAEKTHYPVPTPGNHEI